MPLKRKESDVNNESGGDDELEWLSEAKRSFVHGNNDTTMFNHRNECQGIKSILLLLLLTCMLLALLVIPTLQNMLPDDTVHEVFQPNSPNVELHVEPKKILYIVRSFSGFYERLGLQSQTWMTHLYPASEAIYVASQFSPDELEKRKYAYLPRAVKSTFSAPICTENNHGMGLCCQEANAFLALATAEEFQAFDWFFFIDDDVFASPSVIRHIVLDYNESSLVSIGTLGCVSKSYSGFCGGGGYLVSRTALKKAAALPNFASEYMNICNVTQYCDIVTAWILENEANITLVNDGRFHPWGMNVAEVLNKSYDNDLWEVTHSLIRKRQKYISQQGRLGHNSSKTSPPPFPSIDMFDHLLKYPKILQAVASRQYATLHYYGGDLTKDYSTLSQKIAFLNLIYDIAIDNSFADESSKVAEEQHMVPKRRSSIKPRPSASDKEKRNETISRGIEHKTQVNWQ